MATDSRGVLRGRCSLGLCNCVQYTRDSGELCSNCFHHPVKHLKLDPAAPPASGQSYSNVTRPTPQYYAPSAAVYTPPQQYYHVNSAPILKQCGADGCTNQVHYDAELGPFDYCSPGCRDRHLLPLERAQLKMDIEENSRKIAVHVSQYSPPSSNSAASATSTNDDSNKKKKMVTIFKQPKEELGIITADVRPGSRLRIVGIDWGSPAHHELKEGHIKLLDIITALNEDSIFSAESFRKSTRDKTRPTLSLLRNQNTPPVKPLLLKVKTKCTSATHIRVVMNPVFINSTTEFGIEPHTIPAPGTTTGLFLGVREEGCTAHLSGVTTKDEVLMYAVMDSKQITEGKVPTTDIYGGFKSDIHKAQIDGKHIILVLKRHPK